MQDFKDKVAVITGGASGIGYAVARALAAAGARLVLADIEEPVLDQAVDSLRADGTEAIGVTTDVGSRSDMQRLADRAYDQFGAVDVLMLNAGVAVFGAIHEMTHADWEWSLQVNLWGCIHGVECFVPRMLAAEQGGHVVFTASFAGLVPNRELAPYNVTKAAVVALADRCARICASRASVPRCCARCGSEQHRLERAQPAAAPRRADRQPPATPRRSAPRSTTACSTALRWRRWCWTRSAATRLYIHTHHEARTYFERRAARISAAFEHAL